MVDERISMLEEKLAEQIKLNEKLEKDCSLYKQKYDDIHDSFWWRLTRPCRILVESIHKEQHPENGEKRYSCGEEMLICHDESKENYVDRVHFSYLTDREPWMVPLNERLSLIKGARKCGKKVHVMIYDEPDTSIFRYRCYNTFQWSKESEKWQCVYFFRKEIDALLLVIDEIDLITLVRLGWSMELDRLVTKVRSVKIPMLYDVDDLVFDLSKLVVLGAALALDMNDRYTYEKWFSYVAHNEYTASQVMGYSVTNHFLGRRISDKFRGEFCVVPNSLNMEQLRVAEKCRKIKAKLKENSAWGKEFIIGYFSGSPTHQQDFDLISGELKRFLDEHHDAKLLVVGFMKLSEILKEAAERGQIVFRPFTDFIELEMYIAGADVNLVPLQVGEFADCKSELKFFEAAVVDTLTVASPTYAYKSCIRDGENGYLCEKGQWYERLTYIYQNRDSLDSVAYKARTECIENYSGKNFIGKMEEAYNSFISK